MTDPTSNDITLLHVGEVADLTKVSIKTVRRWIEAKELAVVRLGRSIRVSRTELARFITARTVGR
jgi:excisionase family DNA binding protein